MRAAFAFSGMHVWSIGHIHPPWLGRLQALISLLIWLAIMALGRLLAYF